MAVDTGTDALDGLRDAVDERRTNFVARVGARTRARERERLEIIVDTSALHFFDPDTGLGIYRDRAAAAPARLERGGALTGSA